jgi:hypothetical protein
MHNSRVVLKTGKKLEGIIWTVRPEEGWFSLVVNGEDLKIQIDECESVITEGERVSKNRIEDCDMLARWRQRVREEREWRRS